MEFDSSLFFWQLMVTALSILCIVSLIIGYNSKEKSFLFYAVYTFFLLFYFILISPYDFEWRDYLYSTRFKTLNWYSQIIYNCSYFIFFLYFLDIKTHLFKFYKFIVRVVGSLFTLGTLAFIYSLLTADSVFFDNFYIYGFVPVLFCFAVYTLVKSFVIPGNLKYFFIIGGGAFISLAMVALFFPIVGWSFFNLNPFLMFYLGVFIEQFIFALGLAYKVKAINQALLDKSFENQQIKEEQNKVLEVKLKEKEAELLDISAKAEEERISRLRSKFEDEINHLHLVSLQSQMNPHFIFNALNSIKVFLIENDKEQVIYYLNKFSKLIRNILESSRVESICLEEELNILDLYVNIENIRFDEKIFLNIDNPEKLNLNTIMVPPMILQPFIENAIWHGLMLKKGEKRINIFFLEKQGTVVMKIRDNGIGREKAKQYIDNKTFKKKSIGLKIIYDRLNYFNQKQNFDYIFKINDLKNEKNQPIGTEIEFFFHFKKHSTLS